jgi:1,4-alpha-glucan branching enzyme
MIAEESTSFFGVTHPLDRYGLGFDLKWNMGWMNDTLKYFSQDPYFRKYHHNLLTFGPLYAFSENFQYVLSHDEVVHGKKSLLSKMPGDLWQKFANLRLLFCYMMTQPGKKLLFMGGELGDYEEWNIHRSLSWHLLSNKESSGLKALVKDLNHLYLNLKALHEKDHSWDGFEWVALDDKDNSVIAYIRKSHDKKVLCVFNFTPQVLHDYIIHVPHVKELKLILNSDSYHYSGSNYLAGYSCEKSEGFDNIKLSLTLPPLAALIFDANYDR